MKKLIAFDLDGTLAESKGKIDAEMADLLIVLLSRGNVAIISGGDYPQFEKQLLPYIKDQSLLINLHIYPTCGTKSYSYIDGEFKKDYSDDLDPVLISKTINIINGAVKQLGFIPEKIYGEIIENRGTQVTFSALGQEAPYEVKKDWDPDFSKRKKIKEIIDIQLPDLSISMGGSSSIDITKKGIDKAYAINKLKEKLNIKEDEMLFIGDALMEGGNDYAVIRTGVECISTSGPEETKLIIKKLLS